MSKHLNSSEHKMRRDASKFQRWETKAQRIALAKVLKLQDLNTFKDCYSYLLKNFPEGLTGAKNVIPITIDGSKMELTIFEPRQDYVSFGLFLPNQRYSRRTLEIHEDWQITEDQVGSIPDFDLVENEPKFSSSDKEIVITAIETIKKKFHKKSVD